MASAMPPPSASSKTAQVCYFDSAQSKFAVLADSSGELYFLYWRDLFAHDRIGEAQRGQSLSIGVRSTPDARTHRRYTLEVHSLVTEAPAFRPPVHTICDRHFDPDALERTVGEHSQGILHFHCCTFDSVRLFDRRFSGPILFTDCNVHDDLRIQRCVSDYDIWFVNSAVASNTSFKGSAVRDIHLEGSDFSGPGGISCRGIAADNVFADCNVQGPADMVWLNEISVTGTLALAGRFWSDIQIMGDQDASPASRRAPERDGLSADRLARVGRVVIGREFYPAERLNRTSVSDSIILSDVEVGESLSIAETSVKRLEIVNARFGSLVASALDVATMFSVNYASFVTEDVCFSLDQVNVGTHLTIHNGTCFHGCVQLESSSVHGHTAIHDSVFYDTARLSLYRLASSRLEIDPISTLYQRERKRLFSAPRFGLLMRESARPLDSAGYSGRRKELAYEYNMLRLWLSDAGQLDQEDEAYANMRRVGETSLSKRILFGHLFGWGVLLTNILMTGLGLIAIFALVFWAVAPSLSPTGALTLSVQAFLGAFFGDWGSYSPTGHVVHLVLAEAAIGVVTITVFVGAYVRKLLR